jgi:hypothetical protein
MPEIVGKSKGDIIAELEELYSLSRATVFNRLKYLGYRIRKYGDSFKLTEEQVGQLDALHDWINSGGRLADYPRPGELATITDGEMEQYAHSINFEDLEGDDELSHAELIRAAQNQAAGILIAENLLTAQMLKNPHLLPSDLLRQVEQSKVAIAPKPKNPLAVAGEWLTKARQYQTEQEQKLREDIQPQGQLA